MSRLCSLTAVELVELLRNGQVTRREIMTEHLDRIASMDGEVGAFSQRIDPEVLLAAAAAADEERSAGCSLPLDGVPISVKEHFDVAGLASTEGVAAHARRVAPADAVVVQRLRRAGALVVGKGKQPDFKSRWNTISELHGVTRNPRDRRLSAGGSSGGDAAAVAAGFVSAGIGTDYGGSIRVPASFCGTWGLHTSPGRIPDTRAVGPSGSTPTAAAMSSIGPLARSPADLELLYGVIRGAVPAAPDSLDVADTKAGPPRVARLSDQLGAPVEPAIVARLDEICEAFAQAGYEVVDAEIPGGARLPELFGELVGTELMNVALPAWGETVGRPAREYLATMFGARQLGEYVGAYVAAFVELREHASRVASWMEQHPLVVAPVTAMPAPPLEFDIDLSDSAAAELFDRMRNVVWVNLLGLPAVAMPNGIQVVARRFAEDELLRACSSIAELVTMP
ncbi:MAG: hypothetical protein JWL67_758 [Solirubrobacterales bacterium]|jgi:amidase|nr:hypothetical protein [Solirubrobacterales bacterium]